MCIQCMNKTCKKCKGHKQVIFHTFVSYKVGNWEMIDVQSWFNPKTSRMESVKTRPNSKVIFEGYICEDCYCEMY